VTTALRKEPRPPVTYDTSGAVTADIKAGRALSRLQMPAELATRPIRPNDHGPMLPSRREFRMVLAALDLDPWLWTGAPNHHDRPMDHPPGAAHVQAAHLLACSPVCDRARPPTHHHGEFRTASEMPCAPVHWRSLSVVHGIAKALDASAAQESRPSRYAQVAQGRTLTASLTK
jgi:hypothetical protein